MNKPPQGRFSTKTAINKLTHDMIEVNRVSYTTASDKRPVLTDVNMTLGPGLYLLTGERASGTTELMQVMASLRRPQSGEVLINGLDVAGRRPSVLISEFT